MALQGEDEYRHEGTLNFVNNQVNPATGSILVRGIFPNPVPSSGTTRVLSPGMFVRVRLPIGQPHPALLVTDRAIGSDQGLKYVYVLSGDNKIEYRRVTTGALQSDGLRAITTGLKPGEWVVIGGLQLVHPKMDVKPDRTPMPSLGQDSQAGEGTAKPPDSSAGRGKPAGETERTGGDGGSTKTKAE
jgi:multidrug efflux system membrane fusion protein